MKHRVDRKIFLDVLNPWSRVDRGIPVSLCEKIYACMRKIGVPAPLIICVHFNKFVYKIPQHILDPG